jgi:nucleotide-binding universal stress UspA family protein
MSPIRNVLVHMDDGPRNASRLRVARDIASQQEAALTALYAVSSLVASAPFEAVVAGGMGIFALQEIDESRLKMARTVAEHARAEPGIGFEWRESGAAGPLPSLVHQAFYADLLVLGQYDPDLRNSGVPQDLVESVVLASGRPAIVIPYTGVRRPIGGTVLIAWKETPQAARAVTAALPLLRKAHEVHVACWAEAGAGDQATVPPPIQSYLARHGVQAQLHQQAAAPGSSVGELMLSMAADVSADLLVMGCYGHSRARELVLGGATRTMVHAMTVPVLMSH